MPQQYRLKSSSSERENNQKFPLFLKQAHFIVFIENADVKSMGSVSQGNFLLFWLFFLLVFNYFIFLSIPVPIVHMGHGCNISKLKR